MALYLHVVHPFHPTDLGRDFLPVNRGTDHSAFRVSGDGFTVLAVAYGTPGTLTAEVLANAKLAAAPWQPFEGVEGVALKDPAMPDVFSFTIPALEDPPAGYHTPFLQIKSGRRVVFQAPLSVYRAEEGDDKPAVAKAAAAAKVPPRPAKRLAEPRDNKSITSPSANNLIPRANFKATGDSYPQNDVKPKLLHVATNTEQECDLLVPDGDGWEATWTLVNYASGTVVKLTANDENGAPDWEDDLTVFENQMNQPPGP